MGTITCPPYAERNEGYTVYWATNEPHKAKKAGCFDGFCPILNLSVGRVVGCCQGVMSVTHYAGYSIQLSNEGYGIEWALFQLCARPIRTYCAEQYPKYDLSPYRA